MYNISKTRAEQIISALEIITENKNSIEYTPPTAQINSLADELLKYKQLLDMGAITQDEFNLKKKQLLGI